MEPIKSYHKYLCPVSGFFNGIFENRPELIHNPKKKEIAFHCDYFDFNAHYYFLGDDITISYQNIRTTRHLYSRLQTHESRKFYILTVLDNPEDEIAINFNHKKQLVDGAAVLFYNNFCDYAILEKDDFKRSYLQIILTQNFIDNYINPQFGEKSVLGEIVQTDSTKLLALNNIEALVSEEVKALMQMLREGSLGLKSKLKVQKTVTTFIETFFQQQLNRDTEGSFHFEHEDADKAHAVAKILDDHLTKPFMGLQTLSQMAYMSVSTINRCFHKRFDMTPFQYFKKMQVKYAKRLLLETEFTVGEIAFHLGYEQPASFIRVFKDFAGETPGSYRTNAQQKHKTLPTQ